MLPEEVRLVLNEDFPHNYKVKQIRSIAGLNLKSKHFPLRSYCNFDNFISLYIEPENMAPWVGKFQMPSPRESLGLSAIYCCANPDQLCVVVNGLTQIINVRSKEPLEPADPSCYNISRVDCCVGGQFILFSGDPWLWAWGSKGLLWDEPADGDDLEILEVNADFIRAKWCFGEGGKPVYCRVNAKTGEWRREDPFVDWKTDS